MKMQLIDLKEKLEVHLLFCYWLNFSTDVEHQESLALHNSGGTAGSGRQSALSQRSAEASQGQSSLQSEGDSGSDWDSWDEQEEETHDKETVFQDFLKKVYQSFQTQG